MTFTIEEVREYVEGHLCTCSNKQELSMNEIIAMLNNALVCIEDGDDGLAAYLDRMEYYKNMQDGRVSVYEASKSMFFDKN